MGLEGAAGACVNTLVKGEAQYIHAVAQAPACSAARSVARAVKVQRASRPSHVTGVSRSRPGGCGVGWGGAAGGRAAPTCTARR